MLIQIVVMGLEAYRRSDCDNMPELEFLLELLET